MIYDFAIFLLSIINMVKNAWTLGSIKKIEMKT